MIEKLEVISIQELLLKEPEYFARKVYRYYSKNFHTPLAEVYKLPWTFVFTHYLEHLVEQKQQSDIFDIAMEVCYPEYIEAEEEAIQRRIREIEEEEELKRQKKKGGQKSPPVQKEQTLQNPHKEEIHLSSDTFAHLEEEMLESNSTSSDNFSDIVEVTEDESEDK